jgi:hypothetical protein
MPTGGFHHTGAVSRHIHEPRTGAEGTHEDMMDTTKAPIIFAHDLAITLARQAEDRGDEAEIDELMELYYMTAGPDRQYTVAELTGAWVGALRAPALDRARTDVDARTTVLSQRIIATRELTGHVAPGTLDRRGAHVGAEICERMVAVLRKRSRSSRDRQEIDSLSWTYAAEAIGCLRSVVE